MKKKIEELENRIEFLENKPQVVGYMSPRALAACSKCCSRALYYMSDNSYRCEAHGI